MSSEGLAMVVNGTLYPMTTQEIASPIGTHRYRALINAFVHMYKYIYLVSSPHVVCYMLICTIYIRGASHSHSSHTQSLFWSRRELRLLNCNRLLLANDTLHSIEVYKGFRTLYGRDNLCISLLGYRLLV